MVSDNNILIAQGGGPTNVINQSLAGIITEAKGKYNIFGSINGVNGIINSKFISLDNLNHDQLKIIANTPGAALGSTRDKPDKKYCYEIIEVFKKKK